MIKKQTLVCWHKMNLYIGILSIVIVSVFGFNSVFAMPLESVSVNVIENDGNKATVELSWNHNGASYYEAGCVSCIPNFSDDTTQNTMILENVTPFADGDALLYIIAYDDEDEITSPKFVFAQSKGCHTVDDQGNKIYENQMKINYIKKY